MPLNTSGVAIGVICCPINGINGEPTETGASSETDDTAGFGRFGFQSVPASCENETTRGSFGLIVFRSLVEEIDHLLDRRDPRDRLFRKRKTKSDRADNLSVDINRRAGHAGKHAGLFNVRATQSRDDRRLSRARKSRQDAENLDAELLRFRAAKNRSRGSLHARDADPRAEIFRGLSVHGLLSRGEPARQAMSIALRIG
jgi:hypothetical protein